MTVAAKPAVKEYIEDGVTLAFAAPFRFLNATDLEVSRIQSGVQTVLTYGTQWSATGGGNDDGGTVTLFATTAGATLRIRRLTARGQNADYQTNDIFPAESHEQALDRAMLINQEQDDDVADIAERGILSKPGQVGLTYDSAGLIDGDILQFTGGVLKRLDRSIFAGKFYGGDASGKLVPLNGTGADAGLREDLAEVAGGALVGSDDGAGGSRWTNIEGFKSYLMSTAGGSIVGWKRSGAGTVDRAVDEVLNGLAVTPEDFGCFAIEDGAASTFDNSAALILAMNSGRRVNCQGKTYSLGSPVNPGGNVKGIYNGQFRWANATAMTQQHYMLEVLDKDDLYICDNVFDLGTIKNTGHTPNQGDSSRGGIKLSSSNENVIIIKRPNVLRNRVFGDGNGTSIYVRSAHQPQVNYNIIHDRVVAGTDTNDAQNGIDISYSVGYECHGNIINGLYYQEGGVLIRQYSRGILHFECRSGSDTGNFLNNIDQAFDYSGAITATATNGNTGIACVGNVISDVRTWGIKWANCGRNSVCTANMIRNFGWAGIVVSGQSAAWPAGNESKASQQLFIHGNYIMDPSDYNARTDCVGVRIIFRTEFPGYPVGVRVLNNYIINTTGNGRLLHGVAQADGDLVPIAGAPYNEVRGNTIIGQTGAPTLGCVPHGLCVLTDAASQSIPNSTWTPVQWGTETVDGQGMHSNSSNTELLLATEAGWYEVDFGLLFAENSAGLRQARIMKNGATVPGGETTAIALNGASVSLRGRCIVYLAAGNNIKVEVYQTSGGALNLLRANSQFSMRRIEQM